MSKANLRNGKTITTSNHIKPSKVGKKVTDHNVLLWVFFCSKGTFDNTDLMRASMLCMACAEPEATLSRVKQSVGYKSCIYDLPDSMLTDEYIQSIIDFKI